MGSGPREIDWAAWRLLEKTSAAVSPSDPGAPLGQSRISSPASDATAVAATNKVNIMPSHDPSDPYHAITRQREAESMPHPELCVL